MFIQTDDNNLFRDTRSMALVSKDCESLNKYKEEKARQKKLNDLCGEVQTLRSDIDQIKSLLLQMVNKDG